MRDLQLEPVFDVWRGCGKSEELWRMANEWMWNDAMSRLSDGVIWDEVVVMWKTKRGLLKHHVNQRSEESHDKEDNKDDSTQGNGIETSLNFGNLEMTVTPKITWQYSWFIAGKTRTYHYETIKTLMTAVLVNMVQQIGLCWVTIPKKKIGIARRRVAHVPLCQCLLDHAASTDANFPRNDSKDTWIPYREY